jgi:hypothetical protein
VSARVLRVTRRRERLRMVIGAVKVLLIWTIVGYTLSAVGVWAIHKAATRDAQALKVDLMLDCALLADEEDPRCE